MDTNELMKEALAYHAEGGPGKIEIRPTKPDATQYDLSLAYSPGVAAPCLAIADDPAKAYDYTIKGNLVAVITNGTAVLGLGDIGPLAAKPVMEGKCMLFKHFIAADVLSFHDIVGKQGKLILQSRRKNCQAHDFDECDVLFLDVVELRVRMEQT